MQIPYVNMANLTYIQDVVMNATTTGQIVEATKNIYLWPLLIFFFAPLIIMLLAVAINRDTKAFLYFGLVFILVFIVNALIFSFVYFWPVLPTLFS